MCGWAGFDFVIIDNEHGSAGMDATEHMLRAARAVDCIPVVRCFEADIARVLDMGASAVQIPMVQDVEQARRLVDKVRYPPLGQRGCAFSTRAAGYGKFGATHTARSNASVALIVMIETPGAIVQAHEIASVEGVDAVFIGPNDLAHAAGYGSNWQAPEVQAMIAQGLAGIAAAGKCPGILTPTVEEAEKYAALGARYLVQVVTSVITRALAQAASGN